VAAGGLAAGALAAGEAFKCAMLKLLPHAFNPTMTAAVFAPIDTVRVELHRPERPMPVTLAGWTSSARSDQLERPYAIARLPSVGLQGRVIEPDSFAPSNLNRYPLMRASHDGLTKAETIVGQFAGGIGLKAAPHRFSSLATEGPLAPAVVVGVDDIPTRWAVQRRWPDWLVVGATTHWSAMASVHEPARPVPNACTPRTNPARADTTQACVSFWAGLQWGLPRPSGSGRRHFLCRAAGIHDRLSAGTAVWAA